MSGRARSSRTTKDLTLKPSIRWTTGEWVARREGFRGKEGPARHVRRTQPHSHHHLAAEGGGQHLVPADTPHKPSLSPLIFPCLEPKTHQPVRHRCR